MAHQHMTGASNKVIITTENSEKKRNLPKEQFERIPTEWTKAKAPTFVMEGPLH
jgi:hypothetical protein